MKKYSAFLFLFFTNLYPSQPCRQICPSRQDCPRPQPCRIDQSDSSSVLDRAPTPVNHKIVPIISPEALSVTQVQVSPVNDVAAKVTERYNRCAERLCLHLLFALS